MIETPFNMNIQNIAGLEKPLAKLVKTISEGVGVVANHVGKFDVAKVKRIGKAKAEVEKQKIIANAEAQEKALEILSRAEKRFALEQYNKQINLENIFVKTRDDLIDKEVSSNPVDKDWTMRFLDIAQNVSREELQDVLAKILSGEIQKPGSYSYQTLDVIKYFNKEKLEILLKFIPFSTTSGILNISRKEASEFFKMYGLDFEEYLTLVSVGLFNSSFTLMSNFELLSEKTETDFIGRTEIKISNKTKDKIFFSFPLYAFSDVGKELRSLLLALSLDRKNAKYIENFISEFNKQRADVKVLQ